MQGETKKYLFIIDPQNDFIEGGSLAVPGGKEALQRIVDSGILEDKSWESIYVSLDSHNPSHLGFGEPKTELRKYLLQDKPRPTSWPSHCVIDTHGWEIYEPLQEKLLCLGDKVHFLEKGGDDMKDSYSIFGEPKGSIIDGLPVEVKWIFYELWRGSNIEIYWSGLAEDYCVYESIKSILERDKKGEIQHRLLFDMTACIKNHIILQGQKNFMSTSWKKT